MTNALPFTFSYMKRLYQLFCQVVIVAPKNTRVLIQWVAFFLTAFLVGLVVTTDMCKRIILERSTVLHQPYIDAPAWLDDVHITTWKRQSTRYPSSREQKVTRFTLHLVPAFCLDSLFSTILHIRPSLFGAEKTTRTPQRPATFFRPCEIRCM